MPTASVPSESAPRAAPRVMRHVRGMVSLTAGIAWLLLCFAAFLPVALIKLLPIPRLRLACTHVLAGIATTFGAGVYRLLPALGVGRMRIETTGLPLRTDGCYLLVCNHQSWADIPAMLAWHAGRVPFPRFFLKREILWIPVIGFVCWALDFPFMRRGSGNAELSRLDRLATRRACERFRSLPVTIVNYAEGTRISAAKHAAQASPYQHLLRPRAGGVGYVFTAMGEQLHAIIDMTVVYPGDRIPGMWDFFCGDGQPIGVHVDVRAVPDTLLGPDAETTREASRVWINDLWADKDARIHTLTQR